METTQLTLTSKNLARATWMDARDKALAAAMAIAEVKDDATFAAAGDAIEALGKLRKELETERKKVTAPLDYMKKQVMKQEKELAAGIEEARERLRAAAGAYATAREAERQRQIEARAEAAAQDEMALDAFGGTLAQPQVVVDPRLKADAVRTVTVWDFEITDETKLDRKFLSPDMAKIRAFVQFAKTQGMDPAAIMEPGLRISKTVRVDGK